jgi:hypothetical protein
MISPFKVTVRNRAESSKATLSPEKKFVGAAPGVLAFSIQFNSGLAFLAISTTFLGLGAAGVALAVFPRWFDQQRTTRMLPWLAVLYAVALVLGFSLEVAVDRAAQHAATGAEPLSSQVQRVLVGSMFLLPSMFLVGLVIALVLRANSDRVGKLYGADLAGGGLGCLLVLPLMDWIGGEVITQRKQHETRLPPHAAAIDPRRSAFITRCGYQCQT